MPSNFEWIFKRDPYAAERERVSGCVNQPRGCGQPGLPHDAPAERLVTLAHSEDRELSDRIPRPAPAALVALVALAGAVLTTSYLLGRASSSARHRRDTGDRRTGWPRRPRLRMRPAAS